LPALPGRAGGAPVNAAVEQDNDTVLLGIATMRETAALLHGRDDGPEALPPVAVSWNPHRELRGHLGLLILGVEAKTRRLLGACRSPGRT
jgi:hypothetical protein